MFFLLSMTAWGFLKPLWTREVNRHTHLVSDVVGSLSLVWTQQLGKVKLIAGFMPTLLYLHVQPPEP